MTSPNEWNPNDVSLSSMSVRQVIPERRIAEVQCGTGTRYEYLDPTSDDALLHSIAPSYGNLKEEMLERMPRSVAQVTQYDDSLEDLPIRQTYSSRERHQFASAEVLADRFGIGLERA